jgi:release factor glutamine methyltransferase
VAETNTVGAALRAARGLLFEAGIDDPASEARPLAEWAFGLSRLELVTRENELVSSDSLAVFRAAIQRRIAGEPVHRIMGFREFFGLRLELSTATLEPRPDTETLVELVRDLIGEQALTDKPLSILDLGTGTGAIALALLSLFKTARATLTDVARDALATAGKNASMLRLADRVATAEGKWFDPVEGRFDLIVSNPPYIPSAVVPSLDIEVREHDPLAALDGGVDGLDPYRAIAFGAAAHLTPSGIVAVEIGYDQAQDVTAIFLASGFVRLELRKDLGGRDRALAFARQ